MQDASTFTCRCLSVLSSLLSALMRTRFSNIKMKMYIYFSCEQKPMTIMLPCGNYGRRYRLQSQCNNNAIFSIAELRSHCWPRELFAHKNRTDLAIIYRNCLSAHSAQQRCWALAWISFTATFIYVRSCSRLLQLQPTEYSCLFRCSIAQHNEVNNAVILARS